MNTKNCKYFNDCSSPICPLDKNKNECVWYPDEEICSLRKFATLLWIQLQKKVIRKTPDNNKYYTFEMLNRNCIVAKRMLGLDPDRDREQQIISWFKKHPVKVRGPMKNTLYTFQNFNP